MKASLGKDLLIVEEVPMTRSQAKRVKEAIRLLAEITMDKTLIIAIKEKKFHVGH